MTGPNKKFDYLIIAFIKIQYVLNCILLITDFAVKLGNFMFSPGAFDPQFVQRTLFSNTAKKHLSIFGLEQLEI